MTPQREIHFAHKVFLVGARAFKARMGNLLYERCVLRSQQSDHLSPYRRLWSPSTLLPYLSGSLDELYGFCYTTVRGGWSSIVTDSVFFASLPGMLGENSSLDGWSRTAISVTMSIFLSNLLRGRSVRRA